MKIKGFKRAEKQFKDKHKMRYHKMLGLSREQRLYLKNMKQA